MIAYNLASALKLPDFARYFQPQVGDHVTEVVPIGETTNAYYIRLETLDSPGVIGDLGHAFGRCGVSLHSLKQKGVTGDGEAKIVLLTHRVKERQLQEALEEIRRQPTTKEVGIVLRVLDE